MARPTLLYIHGIGSGDTARSWLQPLEAVLPRLGYPGLADVEILTPDYSSHLTATARAAVSDVREPIGESQRLDEVHAYERQLARLEDLLGGSARGHQGDSPDDVAATALKLARFQFRQAARYAADANARSQVIAQLQRALLSTDEVVILAHSLGSVVARDLVLRLPDRLRVRRLVTIGSPLAFASFNAPRELAARFPYHLVDGWVNVWNTLDPVSYGRGISHRYPMALDKGIAVGFVGSHFSSTFTATETVALAVGDGLFGSRERAITPIERGVGQALAPHETQLALRLLHGHLLGERGSAKARPRAVAAMALVQELMLDHLIRMYSEHPLPVPSVLADARNGSKPHPLPFLSRQEAVVPFLVLASANPFEPFEIAVEDKARREALGDLAAAVGQARDFGTELYTCLAQARDAVRESSGSWQRWALGAAGMAILLGGPVAWAMAAPAGAAGGAAIVGGLAAFGPGGMVGGLMTIGTLASVGTGATVTALLAESIESVEASVAQLLASAIAGHRFGLGGAAGVWSTLSEMEAELTASIGHLGPYSDPGSPAIRAMEDKRSAVQRAQKHMTDKGLVERIDAAPEGDVDGALLELAARHDQQALTDGS